MSEQRPNAKARGITAGEWEVEHITIGVDADGEAINEVILPPLFDKRYADHELCAEAGNTMNTDGKSPSELVGLVKELLNWAENTEEHLGFIESAYHGEPADECTLLLKQLRDILKETEDFR